MQANHDGYMRIKESVQHFRSIIIIDEANFIIKDTFTGKGVHTFELNYHIHSDSEISSEDNGWWKINNQGVEISIRLQDDNIFKVIKGQKNPPLGWYSSSYGIKCESNVLNCSIRGSAQEIIFVTVISMDSHQEINILSQRLFEIERQIEDSQYLD